MTGLAALLLAAAAVAAPPDGPPRGRWHFVFDGEPALAYSVHFVRSEDGDETRLLVEAAAGRFELVSRQTPDELESFESIRSLATSETLARRLFFRPAAKIPGCEAARPPDPCVVLEGSRGRLAAPLSGFKREKGSPLSLRSREVLSPAFLDRLTALAPVFPLVKDFESYTDDFLELVSPGVFRNAGRKLPRGRRTPGCAFDAGFGYPCSPRDRKIEEKRFSASRPPG